MGGLLTAGAEAQGKFLHVPRYLSGSASLRLIHLMSMKKHHKIRVTGRVQGVFYRASAARKAQELGLTGFVRNEPDGSVYLEAEGDEQTLNAFEAWCRQGPPAARVEACVVREDDVRNYEEFRVER